MSVNNLLETHDTLCAKAKAIMVNKNHDYRGGSGDPFANFRGSSAFGIDPVVGILLRMQDKMQRIKTFAEKGELKVKGEGIEDAIIDLINYSVLAHGMCQEERAVKPETWEITVAPQAAVTNWYEPEADSGDVARFSGYGGVVTRDSYNV